MTDSILSATDGKMASLDNLSDLGLQKRMTAVAKSVGRESTRDEISLGARRSQGGGMMRSLRKLGVLKHMGKKSSPPHEGEGHRYRSNPHFHIAPDLSGTGSVVSLYNRLE